MAHVSKEKDTVEREKIVKRGMRVGGKDGWRRSTVGRRRIGVGEKPGAVDATLKISPLRGLTAT